MEVARLRAELLARDEELELARGQARSLSDECVSLRAGWERAASELSALRQASERHTAQQAQVRQRHPSLGDQAEVEDLLGEFEKRESAAHEKANSRKRELLRVEVRQEKVLSDYTDFLKRLAVSSATDTLPKILELSSAEVLGMGNYGYVVLCRHRVSGRRTVVKLQNERRVDVAVQEWAHGSELGRHPNIVEYTEAIMHRDSTREIEKLLSAGFDAGTLKGKRPRFFPAVWFCLCLEYMDRGSVQDLLNQQLLTTECVGAIARQTAAALAFIHRRKCTHNDIKPENLLLCQSSEGDRLVVKLADLGLADYSLDRSRDCDLFAYTVWCMGLTRSFKRCPAEPAARAEAVQRFLSSAPRGQRALWEALAGLLRGMWQGSMDMAAAAELPALAGREVRVDHHSPKQASELEEAARSHVRKRSEAMEINGRCAAAHHSDSGDEHT